MRKFCRANRCRFLWTLTYATEPASRSEAIRHMRYFYECMRRRYGRIPLLAVLEEGGKNGRLHWHFAADRFLSYEVIKRLWGQGIVHVGDPRKLPGRVPPRRLAAYLAKYVAKDLDGVAEDSPKERAKGEHRYLTTQGFKPAVWRLRYQDAQTALERLHGLYGDPDAVVAFGEPWVDAVWGHWYTFPDGCLHPNRRPPGDT